MAEPSFDTVKANCLILCYLAGIYSGGILYADVNIKQKRIRGLINDFSLILKEVIKCQEETEQDQEVRELEQVEAVVAVDKEEEAGEAALLQARAVIASDPTVAKEQPINWGPPVTSSNALNAELL